MKPKYYIIPAVILLLCILIFSFSFITSTESKALISWSERSLTWEDFELVDEMDEDYVAIIYSEIMCPTLITDSDSKVYAFMNPNRSERLKDEHDSYNVLVHEQYHFNLTEYCARLLRKDIVERGLGGLSLETMKTLRHKYSKKLDSLQTVYDSITDHNSDYRQQRYWELQIDDWLRETAYYQEEDIYKYYDFTKNRTQFFKEIYFTHTYRVLTSYPVGEEALSFGKTYEIEYPNANEQVVKFYKNGKLTNEGNFKTAITRIVKKDSNVVEVHYQNADGTYNTELDACIRKIVIDENDNKIEKYFNANEERVKRNSVFETRWHYSSNESSQYAAYFDKSGKKIPNDQGVYHEKVTLDEKGRTIRFENFDDSHRPQNDSHYIAKYEVSLNKQNKKENYRLYDENGDFAYHLSDYHLAYEYNERGFATRITSLNDQGNPSFDKNGASIYQYTYDLYDRQTSEKRFNTEHRPVIANDDYFHKVTDYDAKGRVIFEANYYPGYVLRFSDQKNGATKYVYEKDTLKKIFNVDAYNDVFENNNQVAITIQTLNSKKEVIKEVYYDADENFAKTTDDAVIYHYKYDTKGNMVETAVYDSLAIPKEFEEDVAIIRWQYDERGNKLKTTYYNAQDELAHANDNVTFNVYKYTSNNQLYERSNFNIKNEPAELDGVFRSHIHLNKAGLDSVYLDYNAQNKLKIGVAITRYFYNDYGNKTKAEFYDAQNKRTKNPNGVSGITYRYNKRQQLIGYTYLDAYDRLTNNQNGVAIEKWDLDPLGHTVTYSYFNKYRKPVLGETGYHKIEYEWNAMGQTTQTTTYGTNNQLIEDTYGSAIYKYTLAPSGLIQIIERYNKNGELADNTDKVAISHYESRLNGLYYLEKELNAAGEVVNDSISE